jgi:hypothetical protein
MSVCPKCGKVGGDTTYHLCITDRPYKYGEAPAETVIEAAEGSLGVDIPSIMRGIGFDQGWEAAIKELREWAETERTVPNSEELIRLLYKLDEMEKVGK